MFNTIPLELEIPFKALPQLELVPHCVLCLLYHICCSRTEHTCSHLSNSWYICWLPICLLAPLQARCWVWLCHLWLPYFTFWTFFTSVLSFWIYILIQTLYVFHLKTREYSFILFNKYQVQINSTSPVESTVYTYHSTISLLSVSFHSHSSFNTKHQGWGQFQFSSGQFRKWRAYKHFSFHELNWIQFILWIDWTEMGLTPNPEKHLDSRISNHTHSILSLFAQN